MAVGVLILGVISFTLIALVSIIGSFQKEIVMAQLKAKQQTDPQTLASLNALREEVRMLRDTTMQYDMSFDNALQNMEKRVAGMERRMNQIEGAPAVPQQIGS
jgi:hypothetical protein